MRHRNIERQLRDTAEQAGERAHHYADRAAEGARDVMERGRRFGSRLGKRDYGQQLSRMAEDLADEANYRYRRVRRQVNRHPVAAVAIVAGTIGAFLLLSRAFRGSSED